MSNKKQKLTLDFLSYFKRLEIGQAIGVAKILGVPLLSSDGMEREGDDILYDICDAFMLLSTPRMKELIKVLRRAV